jgi:hypothetical protein
MAVVGLSTRPPAAKRGVPSRRDGVQSGVQSERNDPRQGTTETAPVRWNALGVVRSFRLGAGRSQVQILSPDFSPLAPRRDTFGQSGTEVRILERFAHFHSSRPRQDAKPVSATASHVVSHAGVRDSGAVDGFYGGRAAWVGTRCHAPGRLRRRGGTSSPYATRSSNSARRATATSPGVAGAPS